MNGEGGQDEQAASSQKWKQNPPGKPGQGAIRCFK